MKIPNNMTDNHRFREMMEYLKTNRYIRNQQDFVERVKSDKATVSQIMNDHIKIPNIMFVNIDTAFPFISTEWLKTGNGDKLRLSQSVGDVSGTVVGANVSGNWNNTSNNDAMNIAGMIELQKGYQDMLSKSQSQIDELLSQNKEQFNRFMAIIEQMVKH